MKAQLIYEDKVIVTQHNKFKDNTEDEIKLALIWKFDNEMMKAAIELQKQMGKAELKDLFELKLT